MNTIARKAYGKINIGLDVTGRRDDGYHLVRMIMQTVGIYDTVRVTVGESGGREDPQSERADITISCDVPEVPTGRANIAYRAAALLKEQYGLKGHISIDIEKRIPMAAGMAGGSTDAAAVILALNELCGLRMSLEEMDRIALALGADVPFCLRTGTWLSEGIGELLTQLIDAPRAHVLIVNPDLEVSTGEVYKALDSLENPGHPDIDSMLSAIGQRDLKALCASMGNILASVTEEQHPVIRDIRGHMSHMGALSSMMTGSGPTVFGLYEDRETAEKALAFFKENECFGRSFLTEFIR